HPRGARRGQPRVAPLPPPRFHRHPAAFQFRRRLPAVRRAGRLPPFACRRPGTGGPDRGGRPVITGGLLRDRARCALALVVLLPALALSGCFTADAGLAITN